MNDVCTMQEVAVDDLIPIRWLIDKISTPKNLCQLLCGKLIT